MLKKFNDFVNEGKQVGIVYHYTTILSLLKILDTDILGDQSLGKYATVSLTRDKNFHERTKIIPTECRIVIDGTGLSNRYKIEPYQWNAAHFQGKPATKSGEIEDQMEEEVKGYIKGISKWIESIDIFELELDPLPFDEDFTSQASAILNIPQDEIRIVDIIDFVKNHIKRVNII
jgi:hypothetical protein